MITLGIIGVVAALTMPSMINNVTEYVNSHRQANIAQKVTKAMEKMQALGLLDGSYKSTDEFVNELQKHLKIAKRCDANNITDCWPSAKVTTSDNEEFDVSKAKLGKNLNIKSNTTNNVALILADGASIILTYNQDADAIDAAAPITANKKLLPVGFGKYQEFAYSSSAASSIDFVMDVNGAKRPNSETIEGKYKDIRSFKNARFTKSCPQAEVEGIGCITELETLYTQAGARDACKNLGLKLPGYQVLRAIYKSGEKGLPTSGEYWSTNAYIYGAPGQGYTYKFDGSDYGVKFTSNYLKVMCIP